MYRKRSLLFFTFCLIVSIAPQILYGQDQLHLANRDLPCVNKNYNILAHIAVDSTLREPLFSEIRINKMVEELNEIFAPICVSFSICEYNILENDYSLGRVPSQPIPTDDQLTELKSRFTLRRRINIYFLDYIKSEYCGTSTAEGILTLLDANIFVERNCPETLTGQVAHHLGHTFGLRNTFDPGSIELVNGDNCATAGDFICDTPADPLGQPLSGATQEERDLVDQGLLQDAFFNSSCEFIYEIKDPNGEYYQPDMGNIMSGYPCKCGFTQDQFRLMVETILSSTIRHF